jgi:hypothetical protein
MTKGAEVGLCTSSWERLETCCRQTAGPTQRRNSGAGVSPPLREIREGNRERHGRLGPPSAWHGVPFFGKGLSLGLSLAGSDSAMSATLTRQTSALDAISILTLRPQTRPRTDITNTLQLYKFEVPSASCEHYLSRSTVWAAGCCGGSAIVRSNRLRMDYARRTHTKSKEREQPNHEKKPCNGYALQQHGRTHYGSDMGCTITLDIRPWYKVLRRQF